MAGPQLVRMQQLCRFLSSAIEHEREVVHNYIQRLLQRELHHADTIDEIQVGEGGLHQASAQLESSLRENGELASRAAAIATKLHASTTDNKTLRDRVRTLAAKNKEQHEELEVLAQEKLAARDREQRLEHDCSRLRHQIDAHKLALEEAKRGLSKAKAERDALAEQLQASTADAERLHDLHTAGQRRAQQLDGQLDETCTQRDLHFRQAKEHADAHGATREQLAQAERAHAEAAARTARDLRDLARERDDLLAELTNKIHQVEDGRERVRDLEKKLAACEKGLQREMQHRNTDRRQAASEAKRADGLAAQLEAAELRVLEIGRLQIEVNHELQSWKGRYHAAQKEKDRILGEERAVNRHISEQLEELGVVMAEDANLLQHVEEDVHDVQHGMQAQRDRETRAKMSQEARLRDIQQMLLNPRGR